MTYETLTVAIHNAVASITLNRPEVRNAFNEIVIAEITHAFTELHRNTHIRAIVLAANGSVFCAGADLNWMQKMAGYTDDENRADAAQLAKMLSTIYTCQHPVVAQVQGDCYAGGMGLLAACDIAVSVDTAHFCLSEVKLGLIPATISPYVIKAMGANAARRYFMTAERFTAQEAYRLGLVHEVVSSEHLTGKVAEIVKALVMNSPYAVRQAKALVRKVGDAMINDSLIASTVESIAHIRASEEGREGVRSFLEKRKPSWLNV